MTIESEHNPDKGVILTTEKGLSIIRRPWWHLGSGLPVVDYNSANEFIIGVMNELKVPGVFNSVDEILPFIKNGKYEDIPYRTFIARPYPFHEVKKRMKGSKKYISIGIEFPVEDVILPTDFNTLEEVRLEFKLTKDDWQKLDAKKNSLRNDYKKAKKRWRESFKK